MTNPGSIDAYLRRKKSPLAGLGAKFVEVGNRYGIDPNLLVAIAGAESAFGRNVRAGTNNPFGWGPHIQFPSWAAGIERVGRGLKTGYFNQGLNTPEKISRKWAPVGASNDPTGLNRNWAGNVNQFLGELGGQKFKVSPSAPGATVGPGTRRGAPAAGVDKAALTNMLLGGDLDLEALLSTMQRQAGVSAAKPVPAAAGNAALPMGPLKLGRVSVAGGADRRGVRTGQGILQFAQQVAGVYGRPLRITTGTNHSQMTVNGNESAHWTGRAADIAASGSQLTRMGRAALIAAGMPRAQAMKVKGGLFNIGGKQIIFNTRQGGNHWNHLHIGLRG